MNFLERGNIVAEYTKDLSAQISKETDIALRTSEIQEEAQESVNILNEKKEPVIEVKDLYKV